MRMFLNCYDKGSNYLVISCTQSDNIETPIVDRLSIEIFDTELFESVKNIILQNSIVKIPKGLSSITLGDLIIDVEDEFESERSSYRTRVMNYCNKRIGNLYTFYFYKFSILNNKLINLGYTITDENANEKYLEILQSSNDDHTALLESYLDIKGKLDEFIALFDDANATLIKIEEAFESQELIDAFNQFNERWN